MMLENNYLSPQIRTFARTEGVPIEQLSSEVREIKSPSLVERANQTLSSGAKFALKFVDIIRRHNPQGLPLLPWEKWYIDEYSSTEEKLDPNAAKTWKDLQTKGITNRQMMILHLQSFGLPEKMILSLADQATTAENRNSWLDFNDAIQGYLGEFIDQIPTTFLATYIQNSATIAVGQRAESAPLAILFGAATTGLHAESIATSFNADNRMRRINDFLATLLHTHQNSHQRSLAAFTTLADIEQLSSRLFISNLAQIQNIQLYVKTVSTILGYLSAQIATSDSWGRLASNMLETLVSVGISISVFHRRLANTQARSDEYVATQSALSEDASNLRRKLKSGRGKSISVDYFRRTRIPSRNEELVEWMRKGNRQSEGMMIGFPWYLAGGRVGLDALFPNNEVPFAAGALINAAVIVSALGPFFNKGSRDIQIAAAKKERERLGKMITAIDSSQHHIPSYSELEAERSRRGITLVYEDYRLALDIMDDHPLVINNIRTGAIARDIEIVEPIVMRKGISLIKAPSGTGKSEFLRVISLEQGHCHELAVSKGIDLIAIEPHTLSELVCYVEAGDVNTETTTAEQMIPFILDTESNLYKEAIKQSALELNLDLADLSLLNSTKVVQGIVQSWSTNPEASPNDPVELQNAKRVLNNAFFILARNIIPQIYSYDQSVEYLKRKTGGKQGTSTGEGQRLEIFKALMKKRAVILLDEPTANLDGEYNDQNSSYYLMYKYITTYQRRYPDSVILVASNDPRFEKSLLNEDSDIADKLICLENGATNGNIRWTSTAYSDKVPVN